MLIPYFWNNLFNFDAQEHTCYFEFTIEIKLRSFYFKLFNRAIALNVFLHKIGRKIPPFVHFVIINLKLFIFSANVIKLNQSGMNFKILSIKNATLILTSRILINYLVSFKNIGSHIFCCVVNFIFTAVNFKMAPQALGLLIFSYH